MPQSAATLCQYATPGHDTQPNISHQRATLCPICHSAQFGTLWRETLPNMPQHTATLWPIGRRIVYHSLVTNDLHISKQGARAIWRGGLVYFFAFNSTGNDPRRSQSDQTATKGTQDLLQNHAAFPKKPQYSYRCSACYPKTGGRSFRELGFCSSPIWANGRKDSHAQP